MSKLTAWLSPTLICTIALVLACSLLFVFDANSLDYQRQAIAEGQWWRLITGNFNHTNLWHLVMNMAGLVVIVSLFEQHFSPLKLIGLILILALLQGLGLYIFYPNTLGYVGLSGILHGIFGYGAVFDIYKGIKMGYWLLVGLIAKIGYEQIFGASHDVSLMINAKVATNAHLIGAISGILCALCMISWIKLRRN